MVRLARADTWTTLADRGPLRRFGRMRRRGRWAEFLHRTDIGAIETMVRFTVRRRHHRGIRALSGGLTLVLLVLGSIGTAWADRKERRAQKQAIEAAAAWLVEMTPDDPVAHLSLALIDRRFEVEALSAMSQRYLDAVEAAEGREKRRLRAFSRLLAVDAPVEAADLEAIEKGIDRLTARALNCQTFPLPTDFELTLRTAIAEGGYLLTHAALALQWLDENGCATPWSRRLHTLAIQQMAKIPDADLRLTDLELEAATFLTYMGAQRLLPPDFLAGVLEAQREDGSWAGDSALDEGTGHWHATSLALWMLLEQVATEPAPIVPQ